MSSYYDLDPGEYDERYTDKYEADAYELADALEAQERTEEHARYLGEVPWTDRVDD